MLTYRPLSNNVVAEINLAHNDKELNSYLGANYRAIPYINTEKWLDSYDMSKEERFVVYNLENQPIGLVTLTGINWVNRSSEFHILLWADQGKGYGKEATLYMLDHAFKDLNLHRVWLLSLATNRRALSLYESVGFQREGLLRQAIFKNGKYEDQVIMSKLK